MASLSLFFDLTHGMMDTVCAAKEKFLEDNF